MVVAAWLCRGIALAFYLLEGQLPFPKDVRVTPQL